MSFEGVIVIITRVFSCMTLLRLCILLGLDIENDDMAAVLAPELCSRSSFRGVRVPIIRNLPYKEGLLDESATWI